MERTELTNIGEFGLIQSIAKKFTSQNESTIKGIGDDAAVIDNGGQFLTLLTTDSLLEGVHFDLSYVPLRHLGYKAVVVGISDIAAMNGIPNQITINIAISNRFSIEAINEFYEGVKLACESYKVDLVGGDTSSSKSGFMISISALGTVSKSNIAYRSGAQPNDILCVTGDLGAAYLGLQVLEREKQVFLSNPEMQPELDTKAYLVQRQLKPEAKTDFIHELLDLGITPTSIIDISDGLASEILHITSQSGVGATIFEEKIPIDELTNDTAIEFNISPVTAALNGGEDYELLYTIKQSDFEKIKNLPDVIPIGFITAEKSSVLVLKSGAQVSLQAQGWKNEA